MITVKSKVNGVELVMPSQTTAKQYGEANDGQVFQRISASTSAKAFVGVDIVDGKIMRAPGETGLPETELDDDGNPLIGSVVDGESEATQQIALKREVLRRKGGQSEPAQVG